MLRPIFEGVETQLGSAETHFTHGKTFFLGDETRFTHVETHF